MPPSIASKAGGNLRDTGARYVLDSRVSGMICTAGRTASGTPPGCSATITSAVANRRVFRPHSTQPDSTDPAPNPRRNCRKAIPVGGSLLDLPAARRYSATLDVEKSPHVDKTHARVAKRIFAPARRLGARSYAGAIRRGPTNRMLGASGEAWLELELAHVGRSRRSRFARSSSKAAPTAGFRGLIRRASTSSFPARLSMTKSRGLRCRITSVIRW